MNDETQLLKPEESGQPSEPDRSFHPPGYDIDCLVADLVLAQGEMTNPPRNKEVEVRTKTGGSYKFRYATLDAIIEHVRKPLTCRGIWFVQVLSEKNGRPCLITTLVHNSGQSISSVFPIIVQPGAGPQEFGSALTYMRRYALSAILGIAADEDDDGNVAHGNTIASASDRKPRPVDVTPRKPYAQQAPSREASPPPATPPPAAAAVSSDATQGPGGGVPPPAQDEPVDPWWPEAVTSKGEYRFPTLQREAQARNIHPATIEKYAKKKYGRSGIRYINRAQAEEIRDEIIRGHLPPGNPAAGDEDRGKLLAALNKLWEKMKFVSGALNSYEAWEDERFPGVTLDHDALGPEELGECIARAQSILDGPDPDDSGAPDDSGKPDDKIPF